MTGKKVKRIISGIISLNMALAYCGVLPVAESFVSLNSVAKAAENVLCSFEDDGKTMIISGSGAVTSSFITENLNPEVTKVVISEGITRIERNAFSARNIVSVSIPASVTDIWEKAFEGCKYLEEVTLNASLTSDNFGYNMFKDCTRLNKVTVGSGVECIGESAFMGCTNLKKIVIHPGVSFINSNAFRYSGITMIEFEGNIPSELSSIAFSDMADDVVIKQKGKRILSSNQSDAVAIEKLVGAGSRESWFELYTPGAEMFEVKLPEGDELIYHSGESKKAVVKAKDGVTGFGTLSVTYKDIDGKTVTAPESVGKYTVYAGVTGGDIYKSGSFEVGSFTIVNRTYALKVTSTANGTVSVDKEKAGKDEVVIVNVKPADGYYASVVSYNDGTEHTITPADGVYSFTMPEKDVTVKASFEKPVAVAAVPATCTETGTKAYWTFGGKAYEDAACTKEIENPDSWKVVSKTGHDYAEVSSKPATCTSKGSKTEKCTNCGDEKTSEFAAKGHSFGEWTLTKEATETVPGTETRKCTSCDAVETRETALKQHEHVAGEPVITPATCTKDGSKVVKCVSCGETLSNEKIAKTGHTEGEWSVKNAATCTLEGIKELKCAVCAAVIDTETIPAAGHKWNAEATTDRNATCTEDGSKSVHCSVCDAVTGAETISATGHKAGGFEVKTAATCTADGEKIQKCTSCGEVLAAEKIAKTGHSFGDWKVVKEPTETETGLKERTCTACKETEKQEMAVLVHTHTPGAFEVKTAATCTADEEEVQKCTSCGEVLDTKKTEAAGHKAGGFEVKTAVTCTSDGVKVQKCTVCGEVLKTETIEKTGHKFGEWVVTVAPAETKSGVKTRTCDNCGADETEVIAALGHTHKPGAYETVPATCTEDGKSVQKCLGCGEVLAEKVTKTSGHKWNDEATVDKAATCTEEGSKSVHCSVCSAVKDAEEIPAAGHSYGDWTVKTPASCTAAGSEIRKCENCDAEETREIPAAGHKWEPNRTVDKEATCTEEGSSSIHCSVCGEKKDFVIIVPSDHFWTPVVDKDATCTESGIESERCEECNALNSSSEIPAFGHHYGEWKVTKEPTWTKLGEETRTCLCGDDSQTRPYGETGVTTVKKAVVKVIKKLKSFFR